MTTGLEGLGVVGGGSLIVVASTVGESECLTTVGWVTLESGLRWYCGLIFRLTRADLDRLGDSGRADGWE